MPGSSSRYVISPKGRKILANGRTAKMYAKQGHELCPPKKVMGLHGRCIKENHPDANAMKKCAPGRKRNPRTGRCASPAAIKASARRASSSPRRAASPAPAKRRGRPAGSKSKKRASPKAKSSSPKKGRGRPKGSKNKSKK